VVSSIHTDLYTIRKMKQELTPFSELIQIVLLLQTVETKLSSFNQVLPPLDHRRGLINLGGHALKMIFGTATISDIHELHKVFEDLQRNADIAHSLANQLTYAKELDTVTAIHTESIVNLSSVLKDSLIRSHDQYQQIIRDILYLLSHNF
jgi:hypothetical protein